MVHQFCVGFLFAVTSSIARPAGGLLKRMPRSCPPSAGLPDNITVVACRSLSRRNNGAVVAAWADPLALALALAVTMTRTA